VLLVRLNIGTRSSGHSSRRRGTWGGKSAVHPPQPVGSGLDPHCRLTTG